MTQPATLPLTIEPIPALQDNYIWALIEPTHGQAILVDIGEAAPALEFLRAQALDLQAIWITHHHHDHIGGVAAVCQAYPDVPVLIHPAIAHLLPKSLNIVPVQAGSAVSALGHPTSVWQIAGHTAEHIAFMVQIDGTKHVFCGDTLFAAGCGRVFSGTIEQLFDSFKRLNHLPADTVFYPAHEYTVSNLRFAQHIEPHNADIAQALRHANALRAKQPPKPTLPTTLAAERLTNPFIRAVADSAALAHAARAQNLPIEPLALFSRLRQLKNNF